MELMLVGGKGSNSEGDPTHPRHNFFYEVYT